MCFVPSWSAKGSEKSLEIRSKSLEIGSVRSCGTQGLPSMFEPHVIPPGPCQRDQHACWCLVWRSRPHLLLPESQPRGSALRWVQNGQEMGSRHENYGRAPPHRALRFPTTLQVPLIRQLSYLCVPMGPALWISLLSLIVPELGFMLFLFIVRKLRSC